jgi:hypothetical protein
MEIGQQCAGEDRRATVNDRNAGDTPATTVERQAERSP